METCFDITCGDQIDDVTSSLQEIWNNPDLVTGKCDKYPYAMASCLLEGQGMRAEPLVTEQNKCVKWKTWWIKDCEDEDMDYKDESFDSSLGCDIGEGAEVECDEAEYEINCFSHKSLSFTDQDCDSKLHGVSLAANRISKLIETADKMVGKELINMLLGNVQQNTFTGTYGTIVGTQTKFTNAQFNAQLLSHIRLTAIKNCINDYKIVSGCNFWEIVDQLRFGACCGDQSQRSNFNDLGINFDPWLDEMTGRNSTFLFNPEKFGFFCVNDYKNFDPQVKFKNDSGTDVFGWTVSSPRLRYRHIEKGGSVSLRPICYDIEYKRECCGRQKNGVQVRFKHNFTIYFKGIRAMAPSGCNDQSCVLEFNNCG